MKLFWSAIALAFTVFAIIAISFSITAGESYLICWAFGIAWSFINAIGAMAESLGLFRMELERSGFDRGESISLCNTYLRTLLAQSNRGRDE